MNLQTRSKAVLGLQWVVGLVLIVESLRFAFAASAARHFAETGMPSWMRPALAWTEIAAAILFLVPFTTPLGGSTAGDFLSRRDAAHLARPVRHRRLAGLCHGRNGDLGLPEQRRIGNNT